jgi:hypothetical protein
MNFILAGVIGGIIAIVGIVIYLVIEAWGSSK